MRPIIFIDVDGPLIPGRQWFDEGNRETKKKHKRLLSSEAIESGITFDAASIEFHKLWFKYSNAVAVFSTYWLNFVTKADLLKLFHSNGLIFDVHTEYETPKFLNWSHRGNEISRWLYDNDHDVFLVVDDDTSVTEAEELENKTVLVDYHQGLSTKDFIAGCKVLGIDAEDLYEKEFGIKKLSPEEKEKARRDLGFLSHCI